MVERLLRGLKKDEKLQGSLQSQILDQGDAVGGSHFLSAEQDSL